MSLSNLTTLPKPKPFLKWVGGKTQLINEIDFLIQSKFSQNDQYFILSNSDVKNFDINNNFFDELYQTYNIKRVLVN